MRGDGVALRMGRSGYRMVQLQLQHLLLALVLAPAELLSSSLLAAVTGEVQMTQLLEVSASVDVTEEVKIERWL
jgi:hypothetical protein